MNAQGFQAPNRLKQNLAAGKCNIGATITMNSPIVAELFSRIGFDWLWVEMEHTAMSIESVQAMLQAVNGSDVTALVRVPWNDKTIIKRVLDTGPDGIIVPLIKTRQEAESAVRAIKYPPWGERGAGLARAQCYGLTGGPYMQSANDQVLTIVMIEDVHGVQNIDEIIQTKGIDAVQIGALDLSGSLGLLGQTDHPQVVAAIDKVLQACLKAKVPCGTVALDPAQASQALAKGYANVILAIDVVTLIGGTKLALSQVVRPSNRAG